MTKVRHQRAGIFGKITTLKMLYDNLGRIAEEYWLLIPEHFTNVEINPYVIMPNHIHGFTTIYDGGGTLYHAPPITENTDFNAMQDVNKLHTKDKRVGISEN